jgi:putative methyltransferase (TIGR04325 family)
MFIWKKTTIKFIKKNKISSEPFNSKIWIKKIEEKIKNRKNFLMSTPLPFILINSITSTDEINIADYGSGAQELFFLLKKNKIKAKINIDSIEVKEICKYLKKKIFSIKNIHINFINEYNFKKKYDYVHISDSLQYNLEWKIFLKKILKKEPKMIILNNLTAGNFSTYTTIQNFYNKKMPYIFFNEKKIIKIFKNYKVIKYLFINKILWKYQRYPQENFKRKERLGYPKTYIFIKKK